MIVESEITAQKRQNQDVFLTLNNSFVTHILGSNLSNECSISYGNVQNSVNGCE